MAKILLTNINPQIDPVVSPELNKSNLQSDKSSIKSVETEQNSNIDEYSMFPDWEVLPPSSIINPRKRKS